MLLAKRQEAAMRRNGMGRNWTVRRTGVERSDGPRRWDRAYQLLLQWAVAEVPHEHGDLCAGVEQAASERPDHRAASRALTGVCPGAGLDAGGGPHLPR